MDIILKLIQAKNNKVIGEDYFVLGHLLSLKWLREKDNEKDQ
jgi:hypothetical protein